MPIQSERAARRKTQVGFFCLALATATNALHPDREASTQLPLQVQCVEEITSRMLRTTVTWDGRDYDIADGIDVLMRVIRDTSTTAKDRTLALLDLSRLGPQLKGHPCLDELIRIYNNATELEKRIFLTCLKASADPRAIPVFVNTLEKEHDMKLRLSAAAGLAQWNVRRGVAELVRLLDSDEPMPQPSQLFYVRDNAMRTFRLMNIRKGWGFPDDKESAQWPSDVMPPAGVADRLKPPPTLAEVRKWYFSNEHRFPDWKLGDPLPEVELAERQADLKQGD